MPHKSGKMEIKMQDELNRSMPASVIAEQSLLGSVLIDPQKISEIAGIISEDDFYLNDHAQIYIAMKQLFNESHEIDTVTLIDTLVHNGVYDKEKSHLQIRANPWRNSV